MTTPTLTDLRPLNRACRELGWSRQTALALIEGGHVRAFRPAGQILVSPTELLAALEKTVLVPGQPGARRRRRAGGGA
jgi:hypothetical protein